MKKQKILFAGDSITYTTGLSYVILSLIKQFYKTGEYEIGYATISGADTTKETFCKDKTGLLKDIGESITFFNAQLLDANKAVQFDRAIDYFSPNIVISMIDPWIQDSIAYSAYRKNFYWINYVTIETPKYPEYCLFPTPVNKTPRKSLKEIMGSADLLIPCTKMGKSCLEGLGLNPIDSIPLGIDLEEEVKQNILKKDAFGSSVSEDDFIFFTVSTNSERKMLAKIIESFYKFKLKINDTKNKYKLYMHVDITRQQGGTDLQGVVSEYKLNNSVFFPTGLNSNKGIPKQELYRRIKACDCAIGLSGGEGYGYLYLESWLHKKPVIYIDYGGHVEFCKDAGLPVKVNDFTYAMNADIHFALADTDDCAKQMAKIVSDKSLARKLGENGWYYIQRLSWDIVGKNFIDIIKEKYREKEKEEDLLTSFKFKRIV